jgi:hypothetical protein
MADRILLSTILVVAALLAVDAVDAAADPTRFSVTVTGQGPDVVLIPGLATPGDVWDVSNRDAEGA